MRQNRFCSLLRLKLTSSLGETLTELLISVLVIVLGLTMFASALMSARKMLARGDAVLKAYYSGRNVLEEEAGKDPDGQLIVTDGTEKADFALPAGGEGPGVYAIDLYSEQGEEGTEGSLGAKYYRYSRMNQGEQDDDGETESDEQ